MPKHDLDVISLIAGVFFGGVAIVFLAERELHWSGRWVWPILLIVAGLVGLLASRRRAAGARS